MKFYSENLRKFYDTEEDCLNAEKAEEDRKLAAKVRAEKLLAEKEERKAALRAKFDELRKHSDEFDAELVQFMKDYPREPLHFTHKSTVHEDSDEWDRLFEDFLF